MYGYLTELAREKGWRIVASNSYGIPMGTPPTPPDLLLSQALGEAIEAGVAVVFSAGNNHALAGGLPGACTPNTVWSFKDRADVLTVGTCDLDGRMWPYSSRGPGEHAGIAGHAEKPDVVAPTPAHSVVLYGDRERYFSSGWGTSGAAPQAAGLTARLWATRPALDRASAFEVIRRSAEPLGHARTCEGAGVIRCREAMDLAGTGDGTAHA